MLEAQLQGREPGWSVLRHMCCTLGLAVAAGVDAGCAAQSFTIDSVETGGRHTVLLSELTCIVLCSNLYDVFNNICADEKEHVKTMTACRDYSIVDDLQLVITAGFACLLSACDLVQAFS